MRLMNTMATAGLALLGSLLLSACATGPADNQDMNSRQDAALSHPFDSTPGHVNTDISGGGIGDFDQKSFNRDLDHVLNP
jgi:hypothetical protein